MDIIFGSSRWEFRIRFSTTAAWGIAAGTLLFGGFHADADLYLSIGDNVSRYSDNGALIDSNFISLTSPTGLAFGPDGTLYVASTNLPQVYSYNPLTGFQTGTFVSYGADNNQNVSNPAGMRFGPDGHLYIADVTNSNVHVYDSTGASIGTLTGPELDQPTTVAFDPSGNLYATSGLGIEKFNTSTQEFETFIQAESSGPWILNNPNDLGFSSAGDLFVLDISGASAGVLRFNSDGTFDQKIIDFSLTSFTPYNMEVGPDGKLYVSGVDGIDGGEILRFNADGSGETVFVSSLGYGPVPTFLASSVPEPSPEWLVLCGTAGFAARSFLRRRGVSPSLTNV